jgi:ribonuclease-3
VFPSAEAGEMTRRRAELVCEDGLASVARSIALGEGLRLGKGETRTGGRDKPRLLASAFEACVAAVYLDGGGDAVMAVCRRIFAERVLQSTAGARDFKTRLQETLQRDGRPPPRYDVLAKTGPEHAMSFEVALLLDGAEVARGTGTAKLEAEQAAARYALEKLEPAARDDDD